MTDTELVDTGQDTRRIGGGVGAAVGGLLILILVIVLIISYIRKRRRCQNSQTTATVYAKHSYILKLTENEQFHAKNTEIIKLNAGDQEAAWINHHQPYPHDEESTSGDDLYNKLKDSPSLIGLQNLFETSTNREQSIVEQSVLASSRSSTDTSGHQTVCNPECVTHIATLTCTSKGLNFVDNTNDFRLEIPEGAIPEGVSVTVDIAVALYGPLVSDLCLLYSGCAFVARNSFSF